MLAKAKAIQDQLSAWRRDFHMQPELGFQETRTAAKVAGIMEGFGCRVRRGVGRTGVVADLGNGSPCIAVRADMDALPLQELTGAAYASQVPGVMHACGHDAHMACALGAALLLTREQFPGSVRFLFQPSEEVGDSEGISGAPRMIADGALEGVDAVIALHVEAVTPCGAIRTEVGPASGGVDSWFAEVIGRGGHGAYPHEALDPFFLTAQVINALNAIVSRRIYPFHPAVVSIGSLHGGHTENVIPDRVKMTGTLRYTEKAVQEQLHAEIRRAFEVARTLGGDYEIKFELGTPPMVNHPEISELVAAVGRDLLRAENVLPWRKELGAEDFGCFMDLVPGTMFALGTHSTGPVFGLHNPNYDLDEDCLAIGAAVFAETALRFLRQNM
ncbi:MAG: amidohydrolase [Chloroflexi bacterium]|nr:amidohydrolase [Chloroflexota bacterium]